MASSTHSRAVKGGQRGANGEWYEGGKFINTVPENSKGIGKSHRPKPLRKAEIEPYTWIIQPFPGAFSLFQLLGGIERFDRAAKKFSFNPDLRLDYAEAAYVLVRQNRIARFNAGERWLPQPYQRGATERTAVPGEGADRIGVSVATLAGSSIELTPYGQFPPGSFHDVVRLTEAPYCAITEEAYKSLAEHAAACDVFTNQAGNLYAFGTTEAGRALLPIDPTLNESVISFHAARATDAEALFPSPEISTDSGPIL